MPNALQSTPASSAVPAAPDIGGFPGGVVPVADGAPALAADAPDQGGGNSPLNPMGGGAAPGGAAGPQMPAPAPTHEQTVAALHHTSQIQKRMGKLLGNPALGKKDARSDIVDAGLDLAQEGLVSIPHVVEQMKTLPSDPAGQLRWVQMQVLMSKLAQRAVLEHHVGAHEGALDWHGEAPMRGDGKTKHADVVSGLMDHYKHSRGEK